MTFLRVDLSDLERLRHDLSTFARKGVPHAARDALNETAFEARRRWVDQIEETFVLRNTFTTRSIRVRKARGTNMSAMKAVVGSTAPYMDIQETGGTEQKKHKHGVPIPTSVSSGEGRNARPRKRLVRRPNRLPNIALGPRGYFRSRKQKNAAAIAMARKAGRKHVFLDLGDRQGLFRLAGGKRRPRVDMVWDLSQESVRVPKTATLQKTLDSVVRDLPGIHVRALLKQLRRARVPGYF